MVDTITLKIGQTGFKYIVPFLKRLYSDYEYQSETVNSSDRVTQMNLRKIRYKDKERHYISGKIYRGSRNYGIKFNINSIDRNVTLEWSVPKWVYGSNLFEFIDYSDVFATSWEYQSKWCKDNLIEHIADILNFISDQSLDKFYQNVTISRFDFCKNIYFSSRASLDEFFESLRSKKKKYAHDYNDVREYGKKQTIMYVTDSFSLKFYKKGDELQRESFVYDMAKNKRLKAVADRCLRFEVSFRNQKLSYIVRQERKDECPNLDELESWLSKRYYFNPFTSISDNQPNFFEYWHLFIFEGIRLLNQWIPETKFSTYSHYSERLDIIADDHFKRTGKRLKTGRLKSVIKLISTGLTFDQLHSESYMSYSGAYEARKRIHKFLGIDIQRISLVSEAITLDYSETQVVLRSQNLL